MSELHYKKEQAERPEWAHLNYITEWFKNSNVGNFAFLMQRLTGLAIVFYLFAHLYSIGEALLYGKIMHHGAPVMDPLGEKAFNHGMAAYNTPLFHVLEYLLMLVVAFHLFNGLRVIAVDWLGYTRQHKSIFWGSMALIIVIAIIGVFFFFPGLNK